MLFSLFLLQPTAQAERGWFARTFGPADDDRDGVYDRDDNCPTFPENVNGYADDDGCPDYLSFVTVQATHNGRRLPYAEYWMRHEGVDYVANGPAMSLEDLVPGARVDVAARHACLSAQGSVRAGSDPVGMRLELHPIRDTVVTVTVHDDQGEPLRAELVWTGSRPSACAPVQRAGDSRRYDVGLGEHPWLVRHRGRTLEGVLRIEEPTPTIELDLVLPSRHGPSVHRMEPVFYFDSGRARLGEAAQQNLPLLVTALTEQPDLTITLVGHADARAGTLYNDELALERATAVRDALVAAGIAPARIRTISRGENDPAEPGYSESALARNRRVEVFTGRQP